MAHEVSGEIDNVADMIQMANKLLKFSLCGETLCIRFLMES